MNLNYSSISTVGKKFKKSPGQKTRNEMNQFHGIFFFDIFHLILMENIQKKFREIIYLISRVFLAWTFLIFLARCDFKEFFIQKFVKYRNNSISRNFLPPF